MFICYCSPPFCFSRFLRVMVVPPDRPPLFEIWGEALWRLLARWTLLDVVQSISHTKSGCFSTCPIDSAICIFFQSFPTFCYFVYHLLLRPGTGRFFRNRRCDFQQSNVAMLVFCFFFLHSFKFACLFKIYIRSLLAHFAVLPLRSRRAQPINKLELQQ